MEGFFVVLSISKFDKLVMAKKRTAPLYDTLQQLSEAITKHGDKVVVENEDRLIDTMTDLVDTTKFKVLACICIICIVERRSIVETPICHVQSICCT